VPTDYAAIRSDNERRYGTDIVRYGPLLLADRYDDRNHFIFELLQNAEDALRRRDDWDGSRAVQFRLSPTVLRVTHSGKPFDVADVRGVCGIGQSIHVITDIGRFGIGFKSVYAFTDRPEIHSGDEDFAIESFVWPAAISRAERQEDQTLIVLPLRAGDEAAHRDVVRGFRRLGPGTLLFLREIEEVSWAVEGGPSGNYARQKPVRLGDNVRRVTVVGQEEGKPKVEETWLIFSRAVLTAGAVVAGYIEIAFAFRPGGEGHQWSVRPVGNSPLVVFFPTILETHLGFRVQGPYRTTPSRDNVPRDNRWNQNLVEETSSLLIEALVWLRTKQLLDTAAIQSLPIDRSKFGENSMFQPLFESVRTALRSEPLLPAYGGSHIQAGRSRLARTQELRALFSATQLGKLFGVKHDVAWLSADISQDRTPELRQYIMRELEVGEVVPETILPRLNRAFLEAQTDSWIRELYEFLNAQPALRRRIEDLPLVRLEGGGHVPASIAGQPQAFLPGTTKTDFPTVRQAVCESEDARAFLRSLGLTEPDPVDDVVRNILRKYRDRKAGVTHAEYESDIRRILQAFRTDSQTQREKLLTALRDTLFVKVVDAGTGATSMSVPIAAYVSTERLKELFAGVAGVPVVDASNACLRGEDVRELLEACGASRSLKPVSVATVLSRERRLELRVAAGWENSSGGEAVEDVTLRGLDLLLRALPTLDARTRAKKAALLWEALSELEDRHGTSVFMGTYRWYYYQPRSATFDASFVRQLNATAWVPSANGNLHQPASVVFDELAWRENVFLLSKIRFRPRVIETLAREAGIDPAALDLLKELGLTSLAQLRARLGLRESSDQASAVGSGEVDAAVASLVGPGHEPLPPLHEQAEEEPVGPAAVDASSGVSGTGSNGGAGVSGSEPRERDAPGAASPAKRSPGSRGGRAFISYIGVQADDEEVDPDGLDQAARATLEAKAVALILRSYPNLRRTPTGNPGYDLFEAGPDGRPVRWIEVKAMTGELTDRPVGLSRRQFESANEHRAAYWLFVVERAADVGRERIIRIQDPAGRGRTFTFDHGWLEVAEPDLHPR
jgi:hypothetical protein